MPNFIGLIGRRALPKAVVGHAHRKGWIDLKLGYALLRDKRVSILTKLAALATGVTLTAVLIAMVVPVEGILALFAPFLGFVLDFAIDGIEFVLFPLVIASIVIRWLAPKAVVESIREGGRC